MEAEPIMTAPRLKLGAGTLDVWRASLDQPPEAVAGLESLLCDDERARAQAFHFDRDRLRFVAGRGILRSLLAGYIGVPPQKVGLRYGPYRKPRLAGDGPWFNVSHSGPVALFAFSDGVEVGVDVELARTLPDGDRIAERFFSPAEVQRLRSLPADQKDAAFLACWTRKEAFVKARGDGLALPLDAFDVSFGPGRPCELLRTAWSAEEAGQWQLVDLSDPAGGYVAALAAHDVGWRVITRRLDTIPVHEQSMILQEMT